MTQAPRQNAQWLSPSSVPAGLTTPDFVFEPLHERHAKLDFEAIMSCRKRLRTELQWDEWPLDDFTLQLNREDLAKHYAEFETGLAFAYTVLNSDCSKCVGCIYIERGGDPQVAQLAFWVIDELLRLEQTLLSDVLEWLRTEWPIQRVIVPLREANQRGRLVAESCGLARDANAEIGALSQHLCFTTEW